MLRKFAPPAALPVDQLAVRQIIADVDKITRGRRRIDIAHALLHIVGMEIASNAISIEAVKRNTASVYTALRAFTREAYKARRTRPKPDNPA